MMSTKFCHKGKANLLLSSDYTQRPDPNNIGVGNECGEVRTTYSHEIQHLLWSSIELLVSLRQFIRERMKGNSS